MKKILSLVLVLALAIGCMSFASAEPLKVYHDYQTTTNEMEYWLIQMSQGAKELTRAAWASAARCASTSSPGPAKKAATTLPSTSGTAIPARWHSTTGSASLPTGSAWKSSSEVPSPLHAYEIQIYFSPV